VAGGNSVLHIFKVDMSETTKLRHARHAAQAGGKQAVPNAPTAPPPDEPPVLKRVCPPFRGWQHPSVAAAAAAAAAAGKTGTGDPVMSSNAAPGMRSRGATADVIAAAVLSADDADEAAAAAADAAKLDRSAVGDSGRDGEGAADQQQMVLAQRGAKEEDYYAACHTDVVKCVIITDSGKIFTAG